MVVRAASKKDHRDLPNYIGIGAKQFWSEPSPERSLLMGRRISMDISKRVSRLNEADTAQKLAYSILLP